MLTHMGVPAKPGNIKLMIHQIVMAMGRNKVQSEKVDGMAFPRMLEDLFIEASPSSNPSSCIMVNYN